MLLLKHKIVSLLIPYNSFILLSNWTRERNHRLDGWMDCCSFLNNLGHECTVQCTIHAPYDAEKLFSKSIYAPYMHRTKHHTCTVQP